jgi:transposase
MALSAQDQIFALAMIEGEGMSPHQVAKHLHAEPKEVEVLHQRYSEEGLGRTLRSSPTVNGSVPTSRPRSPSNGKKSAG